MTGPVFDPVPHDTDPATIYRHVDRVLNRPPVPSCEGQGELLDLPDVSLRVDTPMRRPAQEQLTIELEGVEG